MVRDRKKEFLFALEIVSIASFLWHELIFEPWSASKRSLSFSFVILAGLLIVLAFILSRILKAYVSVLASRTPADKPELKGSFILTLSPFLLLNLTFLQYWIYLNDIDPTLLALSCLGFIYLQIVFLAQLKTSRPKAWMAAKAWNRLAFRELSVQSLSRRLFLVTVLAYVLYLSGLIVPALPFTGDEPHYLLITKSLLADGDINLYNNYLNKDYLKFYPGELDSHAYPGKKGGRYFYSKHQPALPVLIAPFYFLGEKLGKFVFDLSGNASQERKIIIFFSRLPVCFLTAFLSIAFFLYVFELTQKRNIAILSWLVFSFTPPLLFYSQLLYPEILVALILLLVSLQIIQKKNFSLLSLGGAGIGIGLLPWCGIKYVVLAGTISLIIVFLFLRSPGKDAKKALAFAGPILLSAGLYLSLLFHLYGNLSPQTIYKGTAPAGSYPLSRFIVSGFFDFLIRLLGYLFDQRVGVFVIAPVYILLLPDLFLLARRSKKETSVLAGLFFVFWTFCSLNHFYWGGYSPPARPLLPVLWILGLFMAGAFASSRDRVSLVVRNVLVAIGFIMAAVFIRNPSLLFHESLTHPRSSTLLGTTSHFLTRFSNIVIDWRKLVPSLSAPLRENINWIPLLIWIPAVLGMAALFLRSKKSKAQESPPRSLPVHFSGVALLSVLLIANSFLNIRLENGFILKGKEYEVFAQDENTYRTELGGFWVIGKSKTVLIIKTAEPAAKISLALSCPTKGKTTVRLARQTKQVERKSPAGLEQSIVFSAPQGFPWKGSYLYRLQIEENSGFYPSRIDRDSQDNRFLGVFIRIEASLLRSNPK
ncbi:MAG: hypothetical protein MUO28_09540 [Desulfobacterales bacterium]|nr:hypothetical protein [Desulfobacterales bacterium]